jgi:diguanylate cyclase (GGDEF)-like protein/PAS domain S-box-containing protein
MEREKSLDTRSQLAFQQSVEQLQLTLSATHQGWFDLDLMTGQAVVNEQYAIMLGYDPATFTETLGHWHARVHPDDLPAVQGIYRDYVTGKRPDYRVEFRERTSHDEWIWILSVGALVSRDEHNKPARMVGTRLNITDRKSSERMRSEADQRLAFALEAAGIGDFTLDLRTGVTLHSMQHDRCFGYTSPIADWNYDIFLLHIIESDRDRIDSTFKAAMAGGKEYEIEFQVQWPDGSVRWLWSKGRFYLDEHGQPERAAGVVSDITERKHEDAVARAKELRYRLLMENSMDAILQVRSRTEIISANPAACALFRAPESTLLSNNIKALIDPGDARMNALFGALDQTGHARGEVAMVRMDGTRFEAEATSAIYKDHAGEIITSMLIRDITDRKKAAAEINRLAYFDQLTGLPNRRWLMDHIDAAHKKAVMDQQVDALLFIDLDHFKLVNDVRGHAEGDALLKCIAARLGTELQGKGTVGRLGGDEFVIHLPAVAQQFQAGTRAALDMAEVLREAVRQPVEINGQVHTPTASIGITLFPKADETVHDLVREADTAMYRAKAAGRNRIAMFASEMQSELEFRIGLERDLALALQRNELTLLFQAQVNSDGHTAGAELLLRWNQPERGSVPPSVFIPLAEESDLIVHIGKWVIDAACRFEVQTRNCGLTQPLSINISPKQFRHPDFLSQIRHSIAISGARASRLIFEVTEGLLIEDLEEIVDHMNALRELGIRFSIDDFGTGYSSLGYLKRLPLYELKIDKSFVQDLPDDADDVAIVRSIIAIAKHLRLQVVAEGVETIEQAEFLRAAGCDCLQGYLLGKPMPAANCVKPS